MRQRYFTVLSRPTLRLYFRQRTVSRHIPGSRTRYAVSACSGDTRKRSLKRGRSLVLLAMITDGSYPPRSSFMGGLTASMYFFAVSRRMPTSRATLRIDNPLRLAF